MLLHQGARGTCEGARLGAWHFGTPLLDTWAPSGQTPKKGSPCPEELTVSCGDRVICKLLICGRRQSEPHTSRGLGLAVVPALCWHLGHCQDLGSLEDALEWQFWIIWASLLSKIIIILSLKKGSMLMFWFVDILAQEVN